MPSKWYKVALSDADVHSEPISCKFERRAILIVAEGEVIMTNLIYNVDNVDNKQLITEDEAKVILAKFGYNLNEIKIESIGVKKAEEDKILGFVADHFLLKVVLISNNEKKVQTFFIKTVSQENEAKAAIINDFDMFDKELMFFTVIKDKIDVPG